MSAESSHVWIFPNLQEVSEFTWRVCVWMNRLTKNLCACAIFVCASRMVTKFVLVCVCVYRHCCVHTCTEPFGLVCVCLCLRVKVEGLNTGVAASVFSSGFLWRVCGRRGREGCDGFGQGRPFSEQNSAMGWNKAAQRGTAWLARLGWGP